MTRTSWLRVLLMGSVVSVLATLPAAAQNKKPKDAPKAAPKADPPGTAVLMNQYRGWFALRDLNKDAFLDKDELAKAIRGPAAQAYDYRPPAKPDPKDKTQPTTDLDAPPVPRESDSTKELTPEQQSKLQAYYTRFPDYQFLVMLDKDRDDKVSSNEYESWAHDMARAIADQQQQLEEAQKEMLELQRQLARTNLSAQQRNGYNNRYNNSRNRVGNVESQLRRLRDQQRRFQRDNR